METAVTYNYDVIPSSRTHSNDCLKLDIGLRTHNHHDNMLFSPVSHKKPEQWLETVEKFSSSLHHRIFPLTPVTLSTSQNSLTQTSSRNRSPIQHLGKGHQPYLNGFDPKDAPFETEYSLSKKDLLENMGSIYNLKINPKTLQVNSVSKKKKKKVPTKKDTGAWSSPTLSVAPSEQCASLQILSDLHGAISDFSMKPELSLSKLSKSCSKKAGKKIKLVSQIDSVSESSPTTCESDALMTQGSTTDDVLQSPLKQFDAKEEETSTTNFKCPKKNSKGPVKRKPPKTIVRDSYKKNKHKNKSKFTVNLSTDSTQLTDKYLIDKRSFLESNALSLGSHAYSANDYFQHYISSELYEQYLKPRAEPSLGDLAWNNFIHHPERRMGADSLNALFKINATADGDNILHQDLEPGEILRLQSNASSAFHRDINTDPHQFFRSSVAVPDLMYIYYSKFYETFHQLALQKEPTVEACPILSETNTNPSVSVPNLGSNKFSTNGVSSNIPRNPVEISHGCKPTNPQPTHKTESDHTIGSSSRADKRKLQELDIPHNSDSTQERSKKQCIDSLHNEQEDRELMSQHANVKENFEPEVADKQVSPLLLLRATLLAKKAMCSSNNPDNSGLCSSTNLLPRSSKAACDVGKSTSDGINTSAFPTALDLTSNPHESSTSLWNGKPLEQDDASNYAKNPLLQREILNNEAQSIDPAEKLNFDLKEANCSLRPTNCDTVGQEPDADELLTQRAMKLSEVPSCLFPQEKMSEIFEPLIDSKPSRSEVNKDDSIKLLDGNDDVMIETKGEDITQEDTSNLINLRLNITAKINLIKLLQTLSSTLEQTEELNGSVKSENAQKEQLANSCDLLKEEEMHAGVEVDSTKLQVYGPILKIPKRDTLSSASCLPDGGCSDMKFDESHRKNEQQEVGKSSPNNVDNSKINYSLLPKDEPLTANESKLDSTAHASQEVMLGNDNLTVQNRTSSPASSVCTEELFEKSDSDELLKQFEELALTTEEHELLEKIEWRMWMERLAGTGLEFLVKDDPVSSKEFEDELDSDIDIILKNVRETISLQKQNILLKKNAEELQMTITTKANDADSDHVVENHSGKMVDCSGGMDTSASSDVLSEHSKPCLVEEVQDFDQEESKVGLEPADVSQPANNYLMAQTDNKEELIVSTLGWAEPDESRPLSSAHMLHWSYCRMTNHLLDPTRESFKCPLCNYKSPRKGHVERHILIHSGEKPYSCSECNYRSHTKDAMALHARVHSGHKKFICCRCNYATNRKIYLERHLALHDNDPTPCSRCTERPLTKKRDRVLDEAIDVEAVLNLQGELEAPVTAAESDSEGDEPSASSLPSEELDNNNDYTQLLACVKEEFDASQLGEDITLCGCQLFAAKSPDRKKGRVYSSDRPYPCSQCSYRATKKSLLDKHAKVHTGERPFPCPLCKYKASRKAHLLRHMRTHQKELE